MTDPAPAPVSPALPSDTPRRSIVALGDVLDPNCFGGSPWQFLQESRRQGFAQEGWSVDVRRLQGRRVAWNLAQLLRGRRRGGFQFTASGRAAALAQIPEELRRTEVISFHQHFPDPASILRAGGEVNYYLDATYTQLFPSYGYDRTLDPRTVAEAIAYERDAFAAARRVVVSQTWALRSLESDYGVDPAKCAVVLPCANYPVHPGIAPMPTTGRAGRERPFVMGFIGKDWRRKGLVFLDRVATLIRSAGWNVTVKAIGFPKEDGPEGTRVECLGFIDKRTQFGPFLHGCDVGCLFSQAEAAGIAVLEFLGAGIPVAGFTVNGLADLLPAKAGFRLTPDARAEEVAEVFIAYLEDESLQEQYRLEAQRLAPSLLWERCVREFREFWATGTVEAPFRINPAGATPHRQ